MKKWYQWLYLSLIFAAGGVLNYFTNRQITAAIIQVGITLFLAFCQLYCDKKGEKGKKVFSYISIAAVVLIALSAILWMTIL